MSTVFAPPPTMHELLVTVAKMLAASERVRVALVVDGPGPIETSTTTIDRRIVSTAPTLTIEQKIAANVWDHVDDAIAVIELARAGKWAWFENSQCKYIELRIDMRDGGCIIKNREGKRIDTTTLRKQISGGKYEAWPAFRQQPLSGWQKEAADAALTSTAAVHPPEAPEPDVKTNPSEAT